MSGYDFRFFTGVRLSVNKPSYYSTIESIRKHAKTLQNSSPKKQSPVTENKPDNTRIKPGEIIPDDKSNLVSYAAPNDLWLPLHDHLPTNSDSSEEIKTQPAARPNRFYAISCFVMLQ